MFNWIGEWFSSLIYTVMDAFLALVLFIIGLLPVMKIPLDFIESQSALWNAIQSVSCIVPVDTMLIVLPIILLMYSLDFTMSVINWLINKIPSIN
ncbi:hypothetical protein JOD21_003875 [Jeotgalibacillus terrae]|nr:hypothetical protein [Jeotgalibacillus terrae]